MPMPMDVDHPKDGWTKLTFDTGTDADEADTDEADEADTDEADALSSLGALDISFETSGSRRAARETGVGA